jgi:hypothetical protein
MRIWWLWPLKKEREREENYAMGDAAGGGFARKLGVKKSRNLGMRMGYNNRSLQFWGGRGIGNRKSGP